MKKMFIWLLFLAACTGIYYSCQTRSTPDLTTGQKLLIGEWQMDSIDLSRTKDSSLGLLALLYISQDSAHSKLRFSFHGDGLITEQSGEGEADSSRYQWDGEKALLITGQDSTKEKWTIQQLDSLKLVVIAEDSVVFYFEKSRRSK